MLIKIVGFDMCVGGKIGKIFKARVFPESLRKEYRLKLC